MYRKFNFDYELTKISDIKDNYQRLDAFNNYMNSIFISVSKSNTDSDLTNIILQKTQSEHLLDFLYTFGENWSEIKSSIPEEEYINLATALKYARNQIKYSALTDEDFYLPSNVSLNLIKSLELDHQKQSFLNEKSMNRFEFNSSDTAEIISSFQNDDAKINLLLKNPTNVFLEQKDIINIINSFVFDINKFKFISPEICKKLDFTNVELTNIITHMFQDSSKLRALSTLSSSNYSLDQEQIVNVLSHLSQDKLKLNYLTFHSLSSILNTEKEADIRSAAIKIATSLTSDKSKLQILQPVSIQDLKLKNLNIVLLINSLKNDFNKEHIITQAKNLKLNSKNISRVISSMKSDNKKISYLKRQSFSPSEKARIISSFEDVSLLKKYIDEPDIQPYRYAILLGMYDKKDCISKHNFDEIANLAGINLDDINPSIIPILPNEMTVGVELEIVGLNEKGNFNTDLFKEFRTMFGHFVAKRDTSLKGFEDHAGVEIISPILMNHNLKNLLLVVTLIQKNDLGVNETCGGHIHIGADYLDSIEAWKNLCEIWGNNEDLIYQISSRKGTTLRNGVEEFARPISPKLVESIKNGKINLKNENGIARFIKGMKLLQYGPNSEFPHILAAHPETDANAEDFQKYYGLNFKNINTISKNTIEFRLPNGTIELDTLMTNIRLFSSIVDISKQLGDIEIAIKHNKTLTNKQKRLYLAREALINVNPENSGERLSTLMNLLFDGNNSIQQLYIDRYSEYNKESLSKFKFDRLGYRKLYLANSENINEALSEIVTEQIKKKTENISSKVHTNNSENIR